VTIARTCKVLTLLTLFSLFLCLVPIDRVRAEWTGALARHGAPALPADFDHLPYVDPAAPMGGTLRQPVIGTFDNLNPFVVKGRAAQGLTHVYESLMARSWDEPFTLYGLLAEAVEVADDDSAIRFRLDPRARWHDGQPVTPEDVLFSWRTLRDHGRPNLRTYYKRVRTAAVEAPSIVRFDLDPLPDGRFDPELPMILGLMTVIPAHVWRDRPFERTTLEPPLGSGPYRLVRVEPGRLAEYRRVADYWGADLPVRRGLNNFETVRYEYFRDKQIALEAFLAGDLDLIRVDDPATWARIAESEPVRRGAVVLRQFAHGRPEPMRAFMFNLRRWPFDARKVRHALTLAFDFDWINQTYFNGLQQRVDSYYPNSELAAHGPPGPAERHLLEPFADRLPPEILTQAFTLPRTDANGPTSQRRHLRAAFRLLRESGFQVSGNRLLDRSGRPLSFEILLNDPDEERIALEFSRSLARLGITAIVRTVDSSQYQQRLNDFDYDMVINRWISTLSPGNEQLIYYGSAAADQPGSRNYPGIRSPVVNALVEGLAAAETRDDLVAHARALDRVLLWGYYTIPLDYAPGDRLAYAPVLRHPDHHALYGPVLEAWWRTPVQ